MLTSEAKNKLKQLAKEHGYTQRGNAFFRIVGDGVLQTLKFEYLRTHHCLSCGFDSMYGDLPEQRFTASDCIPIYNVVNFLGIEGPCINYEENGLFKEHIITPEQQLSILEKKAFDELDKITTQKSMLDTMCSFEAIPHTSLILAYKMDWLDFRKVAPFLYTKNLKGAAKVLESILHQHNTGNESQRLYYTPEEYEEWLQWMATEDAPLYELLDMVKSADYDVIDNYLQTNYQRNLEYAKFIKR